MRRRRIFVAICILAVALGAGCFLLRSAIAGHATQPAAPSSMHAVALASHTIPNSAAVTTHKQATYRVASSTSAPLPPTGAPLKDTYAELKARADAGDAAAASRLYHDTSTCFNANQIEIRVVPLVPQVIDGTSTGKSEKDLQFQDALLKSFQRQMDFAASNRALCAGLDKDQLGGLAPAALRAAQLGDQQATNCYIDMTTSFMPNLFDHLDWLAQYKQNAMTLADSAIQQGDWAAVHLLEYAYAGTWPHGLLNLLTGVDPAQQYRYLKLEQLGASGDTATNLGNKIGTVSQQLSPDQIAAGDAWAQDTYDNYFNGSSYDSSRIRIGYCFLEDN